jgi:voltage-gated potassium channel
MMKENRRWSRRTIYFLLEPFLAKRGSDKVVKYGLLLLVIANVSAVILQSVKELDQAYHDWFHTFEVFSVAIFTLEYSLRIWTATEGAKKHPIKGRLNFVFSFFGMIDFLSILPFYLPLLTGHTDLRFLRALTLLRIIRVIKLGRYSRPLMTLSKVFHNKAPDLTVALGVVLLLLVVSSSGIYHFEHEAQPDAFGSIPASMWWAVATLTTVGYGDVYPITVGGKIFGSMVAILGFGMVAVPAGILSSGLHDALESEKQQKAHGKHCPTCHQKWDKSQHPTQEDRVA